MDQSEKPPAGGTPQVCAAVTHLQWTLAVDWRTELTELDVQAAPLQPGWRTRATSWRDDQQGTDRWAESIDPSQTPSWAALQQAHIAAGLYPRFRSEPASSNGRYFGWYQDLERRMIIKFDVDGQNDVTPMARAVRGYLDIVHTRPFEEGNTRAACNWVVWSLAGAGLDVADLGPLANLETSPADGAAIRQIADMLSTWER